MRVFLSWSGERSKALAQAIYEWLPLVLHYVEPWLSQADIEAGQRWADQVAQQLETSKFGLLCITRENIASPWLLFEAGALAKSMQDSRVIPLLLDLDFRDVSGPLAQFQAKKTERVGMLEVAMSLNQAAAHPDREDRVRQLFDALWPDLEKKLASIPGAQVPTKPTRTQAEVLEELVGGVRTLDSRLRDMNESSSSAPRNRSRKYYAMLIHDLSRELSEGPGDPMPLLLISSVFRDQMPWLYELGMEAYRSASRNGSSAQTKYARRRFQRALEMTLHGPFPPEELGIDSRGFRSLIQEFEFLLHTTQALSEDHAEGVSKPAPRRKPKKSEGS